MLHIVVACWPDAKRYFNATQGLGVFHPQGLSNLLRLPVRRSLEVIDYSLSLLHPVKERSAVKVTLSSRHGHPAKPPICLTSTSKSLPQYLPSSSCLDTTPPMAPPPGVTVYPTSYDWQHNPYAYHGQGREFGPDSAKDLGEASPAGRGSSYYFGFLITFAILLIVGVCCGIAARRRRLVRRQQRGVDGLVDRGGLRRFGGLIGMDRVEEDNSKTEAKVAPKFHDIKLNVGKGDSANGSWRGDEKGNAFGMDARGVVRGGEIAGPSFAFSSSSVGDAPPQYWASHPSTRGVPVLAIRDGRDGSPKRWFSQLSGPWFTIGKRPLLKPGLGISTPPLSQESNLPPPTTTNGTRPLGFQNDAASSSSVVSVGQGLEARMEVAVVKLNLVPA
ncbi:hypothetical protein BKA70DRAFT_1224142 [Coprinopsis sp. MPI-PUGE-AT-0042]|nr:hypothetical protein BKA70DRAFT_1224142 [Coprinopsis sp. MPI-PUGE-AT-0042]